eukprot:524378-Hanusia_phi.AAC.8
MSEQGLPTLVRWQNVEVWKFKVQSSKLICRTTLVHWQARPGPRTPGLGRSDPAAGRPAAAAARQWHGGSQVSDWHHGMVWHRPARPGRGPPRDRRPGSP